MKIANFEIGESRPPFIIAEMSGNHNGSLQAALNIVDAVASSGAHAIKIQSYTADSMTLDIRDREFLIDDPESLWFGSSLYELYQRASTPYEWHKPIFDRAKTHGLLAFSTPFDRGAVEMLEDLNVPCYKIASFEITDLQLIETVANTRKPMIISTGMATVSEIEDALRVARTNGATQVALMKCTSSYPATPEDSNLNTIKHMRDMFSCEVGLSDHTQGIGAAIASVACGATLIEKHVTLNKRDGGVDSAFSLEPEQLKELVIESATAQKSLGRISYGPSNAEISSLRFRRSLYTIQDILPGEMLTVDNVRALRPGLGLAPKHLSVILGRRATTHLKRGSPILWTDVR